MDFRLVAATNQDLRALVRKKRFRSDLFFRLSTFPLTIPPLRERREDISPLLDYFLRKTNDKYGTTKRFSTAALQHLRAYTWPGNVRELQNIVEQCVITADHEEIAAADLPEHVSLGTTASALLQGDSLDLKTALENCERDIILAAHARYKTTVAVARALGISQPSAARKIARYCRAGNSRASSGGRL